MVKLNNVVNQLYKQIEFFQSGTEHDLERKMNALKQKAWGDKSLLRKVHRAEKLLQRKVELRKGVVGKSAGLTSAAAAPSTLQRADQKTHQAKYLIENCQKFEPLEPKPQVLVRPNARLFFDLFASGLGTDIPLPPNSNQNVLAYFIQFIERRETNSPELKDALKDLKAAYHLSEVQDFDKFVTEVQLRVKERKPFVIPGGWIGATTGHSIYYEFIPDSATHATLRLFNLGDGAENHTRVDTKITPYMEWKGIEISKFEDPDILKLFWELENCLQDFDGKSTNYHSRDIYLSLKEVLNPQNVDDDISFLKTPQTETKNCSLKSLLGYLARRISPQEYKSVMCDIRMDVVSNEARAPSLNYDSPEDHYYLVFKAIQLTGDYVSAQLAHGMVQEIYTEKANLKLKQAHQALSERGIPKRLIDAYKGEFIKAPQEFRLRDPSETPEGKPSSISSNQISENTLKILEGIERVTGNDYQNIIPRLERVVEILKADNNLWRKEGLVIHQALFDFFKMLPIDSLPNVSQEDARKILALTQELNEIYFKSKASLLHPERTEQERYFILKKIWLLQVHLNRIAFKIDSGVLINQIIVCYEPEQLKDKVFDLGRFDPVQKFQEPLINKQIQEIQKKFSLNYEKALLFNESFSFKAFPRTLMQVLEEEKIPFYMKLDPSISKNIRMLEILKNLDQIPKEIRSQIETNIYLHFNDSSFDENALHEKEENLKIAIDGKIYDSSTESVVLNLKYPKLGLRYRGSPWKTPNSFINDFANRFQSGAYSHHFHDTNTQFYGSEDKKVETDEYSSFVTIFGNPETRFNDLLAYWLERPHALKDEAFQKIFLAIIISYTPAQLSADEFELHSIAHLEEWIHRKFILFSQDKKEISSSLFLVTALRYLRKYAPVNPQSQISRPLFNFLENLKTLLGYYQEDTHALQRIYHEIVATLGNQELLTRDQVILFAQAIHFTQYNPLKDVIDFREYEIDKAKLKHGKKILDLCRSDSSVINEIIQVTAKEIANTQDWKETSYGIFTSEQNDATFKPMEGVLKYAQENKQLKPIPSTLLHHPSFASLFPHVTKGTYHVQNGYYEFQDPTTKRMTRVTEKGVIQQFISEEHGFCTYFQNSVQNEILYSSVKNQKNKKQTYPALISENITKNFRHWKTSRDIIVSENIDTHEIQYQTEILGGSHSWVPLKIEEVATGYILSKPSPLFSSIEDPHFIEQWHTREGVLKKVHFPRLGLTFHSKEAHPLRLYSEQFEGFYIDLNAQEVFPIPRFHRGFVLRKDNEKMFLIPRFQFTQPLGKNVLRPEIEVKFDYKDRNLDKSFIPFYAYDMRGQELISKSLEAEYYLASLYALSQNYHKGAALLKKQRGQLLSYVNYPALGESLKTIVQMIELTGCIDANGAALSAYAGYLLMQNGLIHPHPDQIASKMEESTMRSFERFIQKRKHVNIRLFELEEEKFLLDRSFTRKAHVRKAEIEGKPLPSVKVEAIHAKEQDKSEEIPEQDEIYDYLERSESVRKVQIKNLLLTRMNFKKHFSQILSWIIHGTHKKELNFALTFGMNGSDSNTRKMATFLKFVMDNPVAGDFDVKKRFTQAKEILSKKVKPESEQRLKPIIEIKTLPEINVPKPYEPLKGPIPFALPPPPQAFADVSKRFISVQEPKKQNHERLELFLRQGMQNGNPLIKKMYTDLSNDLEEYQKKQPDPRYKIDDRQGLERNLGVDPKAEDELQALEKDILLLANTINPVPQDKDHLELLVTRGQMIPFTFEELIVNFAKQKPELLQKENPTLKTEALQQIYSKLAEYLQLATLKKQKERAASALKDLQEAESKNPQNKKELKFLKQKLAEVCSEERHYKLDPANPKTFAYLVFEYFSEKILRQDQVAIVEEFLKTGNSKLVRQMIMGSGKTQVLLILLAVLRADGNLLSSIIALVPFYKDVSTYANDLIYRAFHRTLSCLHFDRSTPVTEESLIHILNKLKSIRDNQECLMMTDKSLHCLQLRYIEEHVKVEENRSTLSDETLELFNQIIQFLKDYNNPLFDEIDLATKSNHKVCFSLDKPCTFPSHILDIVSQIYRLLYTDEDIQQIARLNTNPEADEKVPCLTFELYQNKLKEALVKKFLKILPEIHFEDIRYREAALAHLEHSALVDFFIQDPKDPERLDKAQKTFDQLPPNLQTLIRSAVELIGFILGATLIKSPDEGYGLDDNDPKALSALPFVAAHTPSIDSEFAKPLIMVCFSIQAHINRGISHECTENAFKELFRRAEDNEELKNSSLKLIQKWQKKVYPTSLGTDTEWEEVCKKINQSNSNKMEFIEDFILPNILVYLEKISSDPQDLIDMSALSTGFAGSLWNSSTMHADLRATPEPGVDSKTLAILMKNANTKAVIVEDDSEKTYTTLDTIPFAMICDAGALFKNVKNLDHARKLSKRYGKQVVFYQDGKQTITDGTREYPFNRNDHKPHTYLTYLDQVNTTGADVPQHVTAISLVTIKKGMLLRDLLQAVWRLRGLDKGQTIRWMVSQEVAELISASLHLPLNSPIGLDAILNYCIQNQGLLLGEDRFKSYLEQLNNVKKQALIHILLSPATKKDKLQAISHFKSAWISKDSLESENYSKIHRPVLTKTLASQIYKETEDDLIKHCPQDVLKKGQIQLQKIYDKYSPPGMFPEEVIKGKHHVDETATMEKESEKENEKISEQEAEITVNKDNYNFWKVIGYIEGDRFEDFIPDERDCIILDISKKKVPSIPLTNHPLFQNPLMTSAFQGVFISLNFFESSFNVNVSHETFLAACELYQKYQKIFDYILIEKNSFRIISSRDANALSPDLKRNIYSIRTSRFPFNSNRKITPEELTFIVRIKVLAGISHFSTKELELLTPWLKKEREHIQHFFENVVLATRSMFTKRKLYKNSSLRKLFNRLNSKKTKTPVEEVPKSFLFLESLINQFHKLLKTEKGVHLHSEYNSIKELAHRLQKQKSYYKNRWEAVEESLKEIDSLMSEPKEVINQPIAIPNVVNTCYINAVMQSFLSSNAIRTRILKTNPRHHPLISPLQEFIAALDSQDVVTLTEAAGKLRDAFYHSGQADLRGSVRQTQDADTILSTLGQVLGLEYTFTHRRIAPISGEGSPHVASPEEKKLIWDPLYTSGDISLQEAFNKNCAPTEVTVEGYKVLSPTTQQPINVPKVISENRILSTPPPLIVFRVGKGNPANIGHYEPYSVDLERDTTLDLSAAFDHPLPVKYTLKATCERRPRGNHWISHVQKNNSWFLCNDGDVKPESPNGALAAYMVYELDEEAEFTV